MNDFYYRPLYRPFAVPLPKPTMLTGTLTQVWVLVTGCIALGIGAGYLLARQWPIG